MRFGLDGPTSGVFADPRLLADLAAEAEQAGWDGLFYLGHPRPHQTPRVPIWLAAGWPRRRPLRRAAHWDGVYLMTVNQETGRLLEPEGQDSFTRATVFSL